MKENKLPHTITNYKIFQDREKHHQFSTNFTHAENYSMGRDRLFESEEVDGEIFTIKAEDLTFMQRCLMITYMTNEELRKNHLTVDCHILIHDNNLLVCWY